MTTLPAVCAGGPPGSAAAAGGSVEVVEAAAAVLRSGGSAVDAVLAAGFAAVMSEPALASLGGGGFLLTASPNAEPEVLDFFVDVPGLGATGPGSVPHVETVVVDFARTGSAATSSEQVFHGGWGTVGVPGCLSGYLDAHERWGRLSLSEIVRPAARLARGGVQLSAGQRVFVHLVSDLLNLTDDSRRVFAEAERSGRYANPAYGDLLEDLGAGRVRGLDGSALGRALLAGSAAGGGLLTATDLASYRPVLRAPLAFARAGSTVWTNPPPSVGGSIVVASLGQLADEGVRPGRPVPWALVAQALADATIAQRQAGQVSTGTTHISVVDGDGRFAALTTSNGSGSGTVIPGFGVAMNNMLGEEDLRPADGSALPPGSRMGSMMAPTLLDQPDGARTVLGTGGSERIRSALLGVLVRLIDEGVTLASAIEAPRLHLTGDGPIHLEPGLADDDLVALDALARSRDWPGLEPWPAPSLFFGGVHAVRREADGAVTAVGDARRTGSVAIVPPP